MHYRWVFFDADGTLFDFEAAQSAALETTLQTAGFAVSPELLALYQRINLALWRSYEQGLISQDQVRVQRFADLLQETGGDTGSAAEMAETYVERLSREGQLLGGALALLDDLDRHCSMALVTNGIAEVQRGRVAVSGVAGRFQAIVISGEVGAAKPAGAFFDAAFAACDHPDRSEVVIVGDSLSSDIKGGADYGITTCWFNPDGRNRGDVAPDLEVADYTSLREVLGWTGG